LIILIKLIISKINDSRDELRLSIFKLVLLLVQTVDEHICVLWID
jgi:hypothetical protein